MSASNPQSDQEQSEEDTENKKTDESSSDKDNEEWDGVERRSADRPWSNVEKNNKENDEILSQEERDALSGDVEELSDESGVISYDFYSPAHINKSSLPALTIINEKIVDSMNEKLDSLLQRQTEVVADDIEISRYSEFINSLPNLVDVNQIKITKIDAQALLCIDGAMIEIFMDSFFGGEGKLSDTKEKNTLTQAELNLSNKIIEMFLDSSRQAWQKLEEIDFQVIQREPQPKLVNLIQDTELVVVCKFKVKLGEESSYIRIAYPYKALDPIKHSLRNIVPEQNDEFNAQLKNQFLNSLKAVPIELNTVLAEFDLTVNQITKLKQGDVIPFLMPDSVTVYSCSTPIFKGKVGTVNDTVAIRIDKWISRLDSKN